MIRITLLALLQLTLVVATAIWTSGCAGTQIGSVGVHASYETEQGQIYSGGVDIGLRDSKTIKPLRK